MKSYSYKPCNMIMSWHKILMTLQVSHSDGCYVRTWSGQGIATLSPFNGSPSQQSPAAWRPKCVEPNWYHHFCLHSFHISKLLLMPFSITSMEPLCDWQSEQLMLRGTAFDIQQDVQELLLEVWACSLRLNKSKSNRCASKGNSAAAEQGLKLGFPLLNLLAADPG